VEVAKKLRSNIVKRNEGVELAKKRGDKAPKKAIPRRKERRAGGCGEEEGGKVRHAAEKGGENTKEQRKGPEKGSDGKLFELKENIRRQNFEGL